MIFDGAHNEPAIKNLINSIKMYYDNRNKVYIISILKRKDYKMVLKMLLKDNNSTFVFTSGNNSEKYASKEELLEVAKKYTNNKNLYTKELKEAIAFVKKNNKNDVIFFVGSFYVYADIINNL